MHELLELQKQSNKPLAEICREKSLDRQTQKDNDLQHWANQIWQDYYDIILNKILTSVNDGGTYCEIFYQDIFCERFEAVELVCLDIICEKLQNEKFFASKEYDSYEGRFYLLVSWKEQAI